MAALFVFDVAVMLLLGIFLRRKTPYQDNSENKSNVDLSNWEYVNVTVASLILGLITLYALLSPIGLASMNGKTIMDYWWIFDSSSCLTYGSRKK